MNTIYQKIHLNKYPVGHLKFLLNGEKKISFTYTPQEELLDTIENKKNNFATLLINARIQTSPERLSQLMSEAIKETGIKSNCKIAVKSLASTISGLFGCDYIYLAIRFLFLKQDFRIFLCLL